MTTEPRGPLSAIVRFCLEHRLIVLLLTAFVLLWGLRVAPFDLEMGFLPRDPVAVDAIPDLGENQQIVFTEWPGRSPRDVEDQVTYPLTVALIGVPGVRTVRSTSMFGFSSINVIFEERIEFYWARTRILEKLASLPPGSLPEGVRPALGPDATGLGQVFWYTLEGRDREGRPRGGWDLDELRSAQDWTVRYALAAADGVAEVASVGGFVREYQVDVDPDAMRAHGVTLEDVFRAVRASNLDVGARTVEINRVEYIVRGLGFLRSLEDLELTVVRATEGVPLYVRDVARVVLGPALRRGVLDKAGQEAVGGVVVVRQGANPLETIRSVEEEIAALAPGLPVRASVDEEAVARTELEAFARAQGFAAFAGAELDHDAWLAWMRARSPADWPAWLHESRVTVVPFYDRTGLIQETLGTLSSALIDQMLITVLVVLVMLRNLPSSLVIGGLLPLAVLLCFVAMKLFGVDANIVALAGIAIAIGTLVDVGIVLAENIVRHLEEAEPSEPSLEVVHRATVEVAGAVLTAVATTVVGFLPVFAMTGAEGKLFRPLAFTKTFALIASIVVALMILPAAAQLLLARPAHGSTRRGRPRLGAALACALAAWLTRALPTAVPVALGALAVLALVHGRLPERWRTLAARASDLVLAAVVLVVLAAHWTPLGPGEGRIANLVFVALVVGGLLFAFALFQRAYPTLLRWCLAHKAAFLSLPLGLCVFGACTWLGFERVFAFVPAAWETVGGDAASVRRTRAWHAAAHALPGLGREFMPPLDEGSFLYMPTTMPHASLAQAHEMLREQDRAIAAIPEVLDVVGKIGRIESALDPAPISMVETVVTLRPEFRSDEDGRVLLFRWDAERGEHARDAEGALIPDASGRPLRQWRDEIESPDDVWEEIVAAAQYPGATSAPRLQPIAARQVMLQTGMRAPMGVKVRGPDLETVERVGLAIEALLREVPGVARETVIADRIVGKPYLEIDLDRTALARHGLSVRDVQEVIEVAIGGEPLTVTVEGRERYPVRVRYQRELRDTLEDLGHILVATHAGAQVPLAELAAIRFERGPQMIRSEDTFPTAYVVFDKEPGQAEVEVVLAARAQLERAAADGRLAVPPGVSWNFGGTWENQVRAQKTLSVVLPFSLFVIFLLLYLQFASVRAALLVWSGVLVAWSGGFVLLWLWGREGFLDVELFGHSLADLFQVGPLQLSVAVWVGFLALFGIATDDGVVMTTYLRQSFARRQPDTVSEVRSAVVAAGTRRVRPCLMTTATTILALLPVLTSRGRGSDLLVPMALPAFGGMTIEVLTMLVVPTLWCWFEERALRRAAAPGRAQPPERGTHGAPVESYPA